MCVCGRTFEQHEKTSLFPFRDAETGDEWTREEQEAAAERDELENRPNSLPEDDAKRAQYPMADGLIDYFPNALAEVSRVSHIGSLKHNKGEPMHWARDKSTDHRNKIARHLVDAGGIDVVVVDGKEERVRHSAYLAWRALANLQDELEREEGYPPSRASRF